jgi:hypothetical protein
MPGELPVRNVRSFPDVQQDLQAIAGRLPFSGKGSPEGNVVAPVGRLYTRTDGGAATTLYVKESGSGAVGWIAK